MDCKLEEWTEEGLLRLSMTVASEPLWRCTHCSGCVRSDVDLLRLLRSKRRRSADTFQLMVEFPARVAVNSFVFIVLNVVQNCQYSSGTAIRTVVCFVGFNVAENFPSAYLTSETCHRDSVIIDE